MGTSRYNRLRHFGRNAAMGMTRGVTGVLLGAAVAGVPVTGAAWADCGTVTQSDAFAVGASLAGGAPQADATRLTDAERAMAVRVLQSNLMVAGLACGAKAEYGRFVGKYRDTLVKHGSALRAHFSSVHGSSEGFKRLNTYVTRVANQASSRMARHGSDYCEEAMSVFGALMAGGSDTLESYSVRYVASLDEPMRSRESGKVQIAENCPAASAREEAVALTSE